MQSSRISETQLSTVRIVPCPSGPNEEWPHGFVIKDGARDGMYLAARHTSGDVRWLDVAVSVGVGAVALRVWLDVESRTLRCRALSRDEAEGHPATVLGGWLNKVEVASLGFDLAALTTLVVLGDDRLAAHLWDLPHAATAVAMPARPVAPVAAPVAARKKACAKTLIGDMGSTLG